MLGGRGARRWVLATSMHREPPAVRLQRGSRARLVQPSRRRDRRLQAVGTALCALAGPCALLAGHRDASRLTDVVTCDDVLHWGAVISR